MERKGIFFKNWWIEQKILQENSMIFRKYKLQNTTVGFYQEHYVQVKDMENF